VEKTSSFERYLCFNFQSLRNGIPLLGVLAKGLSKERSAVDELVEAENPYKTRRLI